jgi:hypothetical protein
MPHLLAGLAAAVILLSPVLPAGAQSAEKPEPACAGLAAKDAADDTSSGENTEILGFFFKTVGTKTTANIQVKNLTTEVPQGATGINWYVVWETPDGQKFVEAAVDFNGDTSFGYGTLDGPDQPGYSQEGEAAGKLHEGENGVIEITVPSAEVGASRGKTLKAPYASATLARSIPVLEAGLVQTVDSAPDEGGGRDYLVEPCVAAAPAPTEPGTQPGANPGAGAEQDATLPVSLVTRSAKARSTRSKRLTLKLKSSEEVTDLRARLLKGAKEQGTGALATLNGTGKLKLKLKRKLRKGPYTLELIGRAGGRQGTRAFKLKIK